MIKRLFLATIFILYSCGTTMADGRIVVDGNYDYDQTQERTYANNACWKGYSKLKKMLKNDARQYCATQGSTGMRLLVMKKWSKIRCRKNRERRRRTTVTVKGRFRALCD